MLKLPRRLASHPGTRSLLASDFADVTASEASFTSTKSRRQALDRIFGRYAVLDRASRGWRGVVMNPAAVRQLQEIRRQLFAPEAVDQEVVTKTVTAVA